MNATSRVRGRTAPSKILVTGGTGFLGSYLCHLLTETGREPIATGIEPFSPEGLFLLGERADSVRFVQCDICDPEAIAALCADRHFDAIIHTAGYVGHEASIIDPARTYAVNIGGTVNLLEAARRAGIAKVIIVSSNAAYHKREYAPFDERHPITSIGAGNPNAHYGTAKMAAEQIGLAYHSFHAIDVIAARVTALYGFGMRAPILMKPLVEAAVRGERVAITSGGPTPRDYTHVADAAAGILMALDADTRKLEQRVFNMSSGMLVTAGTVARVVRDLVPGAEVSIGDTLSMLEEAMVAQRAPLASAAAEATFGFVPQYGIESGLRDYTDRYRAFLSSRRM